MSDSDRPDPKPQRPSETEPPHRGSGAGRSGSASSIGAELGDLDFEPDALLDSLLSDDDEVVAPGAPGPGPKLHEPAVRMFPADDITAVSEDPVSQPEAGARASASGARPVQPPSLPNKLPAAPGGFAARRAAPAPVHVPPRAAPARPVPPRPEATRAAPSPPSLPTAKPGLSPPTAPGLGPPSSSSASIESQFGDDLPFNSDDEIVFGADAELNRDLALDPEALESIQPEALESIQPEALESIQPNAEADPVAFGSAPPEALSATEFEELTPSHSPEPAELSGGGRLSQPSAHSLPPLERPNDAPSSWQDEQPAATRLAQQGAVEQWIARAEFVQREAAGATDPQARARALVVASELWAMAGDTTRARDVAGQAARAAPAMPLAHRQLRWLAAAAGDFGAVAAALETESRASPTPEARAHGACLSAEVHRLLLDDPDSARRKLDQAARALPTDPRAHVMKLAEQLGKSPDAPRVNWPDAPTLAPLVAVCDEIALYRGTDEITAEAPSPPVALNGARRALSNSDRAAAGRLVAGLAQVPGLGRAARWLAAALLAPSAQTRPRAIEILTQILAEQRSPLAERALAARALEQGDPNALNTVFAKPSTPDEQGQAFTAAERVALGALTGAPATSLEPHIRELANDEALRPLAAAAAACLTLPSRVPSPSGGGNASSQAEVLLGRLLALPHMDRATLGAAVDGFIQTHPSHPLSKLLMMELAIVDGDAARVASALAEWPQAQPGNSEEECDRHLAAALVYEAAGARDAAAREYASALAAGPSNVAAARALIGDAPPSGAADLLVALSQAVSDKAQRSLFLVEAALRRGARDAEQFDTLLSQAATALPTLPFAYRLGEQLSRSRGDADQLLAWLRARREASVDPVEQALDLVREALLVADSDMQLAAKLLEDATKTRPSDIGLSELHDRLTPEARVEKGAWRERAARETGGEAQLRFLLEATLEYERAGDAEAAARASLEAAELGGSEFARATAERVAGFGPGAARLAEQLLARAREEQDPVAQRELYERLSKIDAARGDHSSALLWQSAVLERTPNYLPALRRLEHEYIGAGRDEELDPIAAALTQLVQRNEANAHAMLATRLRARGGNWQSARELVAAAAQQPKPSLWALREQCSHAQAAEDDAALFQAQRQLCEVSTRAIDAATLALRAAEAAARLSRLDEARELLERAVEMVPEHLVALTTRAEVLEACGNFSGAAESLEALAEVSAVDAHRLGAWYHAALLWLDKAGEKERAQAALEHAADIDPSSEDVFNRLQALYVQGGQRAKLAQLLERRLAQTADPEQRVALEVSRGRALAEVGDHQAAKQALAAALDANPDHADALAAFADLCAAEGDWASAEQSWIRLARHLTEPERQADIYRKLGALYDHELPNPQRAELAYREVLKRVPDDPDATERLIQVYAQLNNPARSVELATELVNKAETQEDKRDRTIGLAEVLEQIAGDPRRAETTLDRARKTWSHDSKVLRALAEFYRRSGEDRAEHVLLDRAAADARRALSTGRFDASFFQVLGAVAELRGNHDAAQVTEATLAALTGKDQPVRAAGPGASDPRLDEVLAPDMLTLPFRSLLKKTGDALDAAYPLDLRALRATPFPAEGAMFAEHVRQLAQPFGIYNVDVFVSQSLGSVCVPASSNPPQIVFGKALLDSSDEAARYYLLMRSLKILQAHAATLSRTAPIDLWPITAAYLSVFAPDWQPQGVDMKRMNEARQRIQAAMPRHLDTDVPVLALEVIGSIGNRASQLATAINEWGNRTALLAMGNPAASLRAIAFASGQSLPDDPGERVKWIARHTEARDLMVFSVSEQYADARKRLGLT